MNSFVASKFKRKEPFHAPQPLPQTSFGNKEYTEEERLRIQRVLEEGLPQKKISTRAGPGGQKVSYIAGETQIEIANAIFGFNGWSCHVVSVEVEYHEYDKKRERWDVGVSALVRVQLKDGAFHEDIGSNSKQNKDRIKAIELAKKSAITDARKRALRLFGQQLGNSIYDKEHVKQARMGKVQEQEYHIQRNHPFGGNEASFMEDDNTLGQQYVAGFNPPVPVQPMHTNTLPHDETGSRNSPADISHQQQQAYVAQEPLQGFNSNALSKPDTRLSPANQNTVSANAPVNTFNAAQTAASSCKSTSLYQAGNHSTGMSNTNSGRPSISAENGQYKAAGAGQASGGGTSSEYGHAYSSNNSNAMATTGGGVGVGTKYQNGHPSSPRVEKDYDGSSCNINAAALEETLTFTQMESDPGFLESLKQIEARHSTPANMLSTLPSSTKNQSGTSHHNSGGSSSDYCGSRNHRYLPHQHSNHIRNGGNKDTNKRGRHSYS